MTSTIDCQEDSELGKKIVTLTIRLTSEMLEDFGYASEAQELKPARLARRLFAQEIKRMAHKANVLTKLLKRHGSLENPENIENSVCDDIFDE